MSLVDAPIRLSIVAPSYREAPGLAELHRRTTLVAQPAS